MVKWILKEFYNYAILNYLYTYVIQRDLRVTIWLLSEIISAKKLISVNTVPNSEPDQKPFDPEKSLGRRHK